VANINLNQKGVNVYAFYRIFKFFRYYDDVGICISRKLPNNIFHWIGYNGSRRGAAHIDVWN